MEFTLQNKRCINSERVLHKIVINALESLMPQKGKTQGYYLPHDLIDWLEQTAPQQGRSASNYLAYIVRKEKDASSVTPAQA